MDKSAKKQKPIDNLMVKSIDAIYKYGGFTIDVKDYNYKLFIDWKGELTLERHDKHADAMITTVNVERFLAILAYHTFFNKEHQIIRIMPYRLNVSREHKLKSANEMYAVFESILVDNPERIKEVIAANDASVFMNIAANSKKNDNIFDNIEELIINLEEMTYEYSEDLIYGITLYESLRIASQKDAEFIKKEWDEFVSHNRPNFHKGEEYKSEMESKNKFEVPGEVLNDREFIVNPAVGREAELREIGASLLSYSGNPILLGEPGVGKTAIIEGLAYKINKKDISERLLDKKILKISPAAIVSGCMYRGMFEERMQKIIEYLEENPEYILYIDEMHTAYGTGSSSTSDNDMVNILKPYIENGSIKVIGATTSAEYEDIMLRDKAFSRRLKPITISEPTEEVLKIIIENNISKYEHVSGVLFAANVAEKDAIIEILIEATRGKNRTYKEKRYNPALILSIIEQAFGYASYDEDVFVGTKYIVESLNRCESIYESVRTRTCEQLKNLHLDEKPKAKIIEFKQIKELS